MNSENRIIISSDVKDTVLVKSDKLSVLFDALFTYIVENKCTVAYCQIGIEDKFHDISFVDQTITVEKFTGDYYKIAIITEGKTSIDPYISLDSVKLIQTLLNYTPTYFNLYANPFVK